MSSTPPRLPASEKPWLGSYPPGVPAEIDPDSFPSLVAVAEDSFRRYRELPAFTCMGRTLTYAEVDALSGAFAAFLQQRGLRRGDRVALMMPNVLQYPICLLGTLRAGGVVVNVNPLYTPRELRDQLADAAPRVLVVMETSAHVYEQVEREVAVPEVVVTRFGDMLGWRGPLVDFAVRRLKKLVAPWSLPQASDFRAVIAAGGAPAHVELNGDDLAFLQYTGGTTGVAKGAMLTHRNVVANLLQVQAWCTPLQPGCERVVTALPLYHIFALVANALLFVRLGAHNLLIPNPRDLRGMVKTLQRWPFTAMTGVNTLFNALLHTPGFERVDFSGLKVCLGGGMAVHRSVAERWREVTGKPLIEGYGLTEASPVVCVNRLDVPEYTGSIGLPLPSTEIMVTDDHGRPAPPNTVGELCVRGPQVMRGYWQRPDETRKVLVDGWLHTGDIATIDERGYTRIVDRKKDMIVVSGFKVFPNEIEAIVAQLPGVAEVGAVGVPDAEGNESVKVVIVKRDPSLTEEQVLAHCREKLTRYKVPKTVEFRASLPKSNVGKILRRELR
ncbi:MAG TPA: AMP-binding protein [Planctomycetota bacterium]|nr:AMP-binding protein [Planctomycetota bacterium]